MSEKAIDLTRSERATIILQTLLQVVPGVGSAIHQGVFGVLNERRLKRLEESMREVAEEIAKRDRAPQGDSEPFLNLLEALAPAIAAATHEDKRRALRNMLVNGATTAHDDPRWDEAQLAASIVSTIDPAGLALIAAGPRLNTEEVTVWRSPYPAAFAGSHEFGRTAPEPPANLERVRLPYSWIVITEAARRLYAPNGACLIQGMWSYGNDEGFAFRPMSLARIVIDWALTLNAE